jgi:HAE1 family hydrophobic/amphiphilic exporter-1
MVATFRSIIQPLILLVSIPFAATGAFALLLITNTALGISAIIGMLLLVGVVVTNAIVLIDLINQYRRDGKNVRDAIMDGARQRLRPILMTALATIFALMPMALGFTGGGGFISQPLAIVVIGGLFSSTVLTLVIVPTLYWIIEGRKDRKALKAA